MLTDITLYKINSKSIFVLINGFADINKRDKKKFWHITLNE